MFPHYNVDEQPNKRPKKGHFPRKKRKRRQECCGNCEKRITIGLCITRIGCTRFSRNERVPGKPDANRLGTNSKSTVRSSLHHVNQVSGKRKDHRLKKRSQTSTSAKSLRYKIRGSVPRRDWKTRAMCPKQGLGSCQKCIQAQSERQSYILLACKVGSPWSLSKKVRGERVCGRFGSEYAYGQ